MNTNNKNTERKELRKFIEKNMPIGIRPTRQAKTTFVRPFTSNHARMVVIDALVEAFFNQKTKK